MIQCTTTPANGHTFFHSLVPYLCCFNSHLCRQEQRRALQKLEQRASDLETQLSDALVDVQRRDSTISELKAALQVRLPMHPFVLALVLHHVWSYLTRDFVGQRCRVKHLWGLAPQSSSFSVSTSTTNCCCKEAVRSLFNNLYFCLSSYMLMLLCIGIFACSCFHTTHLPALAYYQQQQSTYDAPTSQSSK